MQVQQWRTKINASTSKVDKALRYFNENKKHKH
ncbi:hypothetical protein MNBD_PLANCTO02-774 [hydrothermal vent metagenome]|uniref:Uncharacterized protein n=1 Tax=hydrothermal vent metagenome TaxID=652676 RepID=A0A3B1E0T5_9ZZZZ